MENQKLSFDQLPEAVSRLTAQMENIERMLRDDTPCSEPDEFLNLDQTCKMLDLSKPTVYGLVSHRQIPHSKRGGRLRFLKSEIHAWVLQSKRKTMDELKAEITEGK
ncbi:MAG: helix-turn-helix domain-containing protein [Bacteroidetes bacterium]|nr:helix-turn-helix domain-containing protein [Bacteroidota bacterium]